MATSPSKPQGNTIPLQPPTTKTPPAQQIDNEREWENSLWDCCKPADLCLQACFCPCVLFGKTHHRLEDASMTDYSAVNKWCIAQACCQLGGLAFLLPMQDRAEMRRRWGLKGSTGDDCFKTWCCGGVALLQHEKEVALLTGREQRVGAGVSVGEGERGYQREEDGMRYAAPTN